MHQLCANIVVMNDTSAELLLKQCRTCLQQKPLTTFYVENAIRKTTKADCIPCYTKLTLERRRRNPDKVRAYQKKYDAEVKRPNARQYVWGTRRAGIDSWLNALKENPCADCGRTYHPTQMDLDHVRGEKLFNISYGRVISIADDLLLEEIQKCDLVCSNCHRLRTWRRKHPTP